MYLLRKHFASRWFKKQDAMLTFKNFIQQLLFLWSAFLSCLVKVVIKASIFTRALDGGLLVALKILRSVLKISNSAFCLSSKYYYYYHYYNCNNYYHYFLLLLLLSLLLSSYFVICILF